MCSFGSLLMFSVPSSPFSANPLRESKCANPDIIPHLPRWKVGAAQSPTHRFIQFGKPTTLPQFDRTDRAVCIDDEFYGDSSAVVLSLGGERIIRFGNRTFRRVWIELSIFRNSLGHGRWRRGKTRLLYRYCPDNRDGKCDLGWISGGDHHSHLRRLGRSFLRLLLL